MPGPRPRKRRRPRVTVLRLGHRPARDPRLTTHVALVARAFGAQEMWLHPPDPALADRIGQVSARWGGSFRVTGVERWRSAVEAFPGTRVHLTMYGTPVDAALPQLRRAQDVLAVVGGPKVPPELFGLADLNVAVGAQPHSEVAALAILLDRLLGRPPPSSFRGARQRIVPTTRGKRVVESGHLPGPT